MSLMLGLVFLAVGGLLIYLAVQGFSGNKPLHQELWDSLIGTVQNG